LAQEDPDLECESDAGKGLLAAVESVIMILLIHGAGAVGLGLGSCLLSAGAEVDLIARQDTVSSLRKHGLPRTGILGSYHAGPTEFGSYSSLKELPPRDYDYILACVKSFDSRDSARDLAAAQKALRIPFPQVEWMRPSSIAHESQP
jgi:2-dehydropantoate 2-reductase